MKSKKILKIAAFILAGGLLLQTGILAYTGVLGGISTGDVDISQVVVSQEIQSLIKGQDTVHYDKNIKNYKQMIVLLNVHEEFKNDLESIVKKGKKITDIMIAYNFLNDYYGKVAQVEILVDQKEAGENWVNIFKQYNKNNRAFTPRNFDFDYLDKLMKQAGITNDDIMIADRVSQNAEVTFNEVINEKIAGKPWRDINAGFGIVNGQEMMPRVSVTREQLKKYKAGGALSEEQITETLVTAYKLGLGEQAAIDKTKAGYTMESFFAEALEQKYY